MKLIRLPRAPISSRRRRRRYFLYKTMCSECVPVLFGSCFRNTQPRRWWLAYVNGSSVSRVSLKKKRKKNTQNKKTKTPRSARNKNKIPNKTKTTIKRHRKEVLITCFFLLAFALCYLFLLLQVRCAWIRFLCCVFFVIFFCCSVPISLGSVWYTARRSVSVIFYLLVIQ